MSESKHSLEKTLRNSVGGMCAFPEKVSLPIDSSGTRVTKRVRGGMGESRRFQEVIKKMVESGEITEEQANGDWAKVG